MQINLTLSGDACNVKLVCSCDGCFNVLSHVHFILKFCSCCCRGMAGERDEERLKRIQEFRRQTPLSSVWQYSFRDAILYALSVGCKRTERKFVYENDADFATLPSFAVVAVHKAKLDYQHLLPNFDPVRTILTD